MSQSNNNIISLTTNNTISEMMSKVNELTFELNNYTWKTTNTGYIPESVSVGDVLIGLEHLSVSEHLANNYAHGIVINDLFFNSNTGVLDISFNDLSSSNINLQIGREDDPVFKTLTANTVYAEKIRATSNVDIYGLVRVSNSLFISSNLNVLGDTTFNNIIITGTTEVDTDLYVGGDVNIVGNLTITGGTTTVNTTILLVEDKNIELGVVASPTDISADGGGITLKGTTDKTIIWDLGNSNWSSSESWNLGVGKVYKINNVSVLSSNTLGSSVVNSSLTSVGNITTGVWNGSTIAINRGGTNITSYTKGDILYASSDNVLNSLSIGSEDQILQVTSNGGILWVSSTDAGEY